MAEAGGDDESMAYLEWASLSTDQPFESWYIDRLARELAASAARERRLRAVLTRLLYGGDEPSEINERHHTGCAVYDPVDHGPCDCGVSDVIHALAAGQEATGG